MSTYDMQAHCRGHVHGAEQTDSEDSKMEEIEKKMKREKTACAFVFAVA